MLQNLWNFIDGVKNGFYNVTHPYEWITGGLKFLINSSHYIFIVVCLLGLTLSFAEIKKGRSIAVGSVIVYVFLRMLVMAL